MGQLPSAGVGLSRVGGTGYLSGYGASLAEADIDASVAGPLGTNNLRGVRPASLHCGYPIEQ